MIFQGGSDPLSPSGSAHFKNCMCVNVYIGCYHIEDKGFNYSGPVSYAKNGKQCVQWQMFGYEFDGNRCMNPTPKDRDAPWCFTDQGDIETFNIPTCCKCFSYIIHFIIHKHVLNNLLQQASWRYSPQKVSKLSYKFLLYKIGKYCFKRL